MTKQNKNKNKTGNNNKPSPRDPRGVRINNYTETTHGRQKTKQATPNETRVLLQTLKQNFNNTVSTGEPGEYVRTGPGRPPKYPTVESFLKVVNDYFTYLNDTYEQTGVELIPDIEGFCSYAGIYRSLLFEWETSKPAEYSNIIKQLKNTIAAYKKQLGMNGRIPPIVLAMDFNNNHGYVQQQQINMQVRPAELPTVDDIRKKLPKNGDNNTGSDNDFIDI